MSSAQYLNVANGYHIGQPECRTTPWLEKVLSDNTGLGQWFSNSVALWNRLENFKKKKNAEFHP